METKAGTSTALYYNDKWQVVEERVNGQTTAQNVWSPIGSDKMVRRDTNPVNGVLTQRIYVQQDMIGNVTAALNAAGAVLARFLYTPFGQQSVYDANWNPLGASPVDLPYGFQGLRTDFDLDIADDRERVYVVGLQRFAQNDPIQFGGGTANFYAFVGNNPISRTDLYGEGWGDFFRGAGKALVGVAIGVAVVAVFVVAAPAVIGVAATAAVVATVAVVGTVATAATASEAITGKELLTGRQLTTAERHERAGEAVVGIAAIAIGGNRRINIPQGRPALVPALVPAGGPRLPVPVAGAPAIPVPLPVGPAIAAPIPAIVQMAGKPGGGGEEGGKPEEPCENGGERNPAQDKMLTKGDIKKLQDADYDIHDLKGGKNASKYDLYKDPHGNVYIKPKGGAGPGDPTGINLNDL